MEPHTAIRTRKLVRVFFLAGILTGSSLGAWLMGRIRNAPLRGWLEVEMGLSAVLLIAIGVSRLRLWTAPSDAP